MFGDLSIFSNTVFGTVHNKRHAKRHLTVFTLLVMKLYYTDSLCLPFPYEFQCFTVFNNRHIFSKHSLHYFKFLTLSHQSLHENFKTTYLGMKSNLIIEHLHTVHLLKLKPFRYSTVNSTLNS